MSRTDRNPDAAAPATELDLTRFLPYRLNNLGGRISQALAVIYRRRFGISIPEWRILVWLNERPVLTAKQLTELTQMDKVRVSRSVRALESRNLIHRQPSTEDQRQQWLRLTDDARALLAELIPATRRWEAELAATLSEGEHEALLAALNKLEERLDHLVAAESGQD